MRDDDMDFMMPNQMQKPGLKDEQSERDYHARQKSKLSQSEPRKSPNQFENVDMETAQQHLKRNPNDMRARVDFLDKFGEENAPDSDEDELDHVRERMGSVGK